MADERFRKIYKKWENSGIPAEPNEMVQIAQKPLMDLISGYLNKGRRGGVFNLEESIEESKKVGAAFGMTVWACFYIGVEYERERSNAPQISYEPSGDSVKINLDFEEWAVLEACVEAARQYILRKSRLAKQSLTRQEEDVVKRIDDVQSVVRSSAMQSTDHLPIHKLQTRLDKAQAFNSLLISTYASVEEAILDWQFGKNRGD